MANVCFWMRFYDASWSIKWNEEYKSLSLWLALMAIFPGVAIIKSYFERNSKELNAFLLKRKSGIVKEGKNTYMKKFK